MKNIFLLLIGVVFLSSCEKKTDNKTAINMGTIDSLFSKTLNEQRKVWVYVPNQSRNGALYSKAKYPVLYLLDGDSHFKSVAGMIENMSSNTLCPEMIIVAIPNTDRTRDLTPTYVKTVFGDTTFSKTSGGGENFTKFISEELIPYIDKNYPTTSHRMLIGHSLGGLFAVNTLIHHPDIFDNYLAIDPSLWWDNRKLSKESATILDQNKFSRKSLYVAVANTMKEGMELTELPSDTTEDTEHIRSILGFIESTKTKTYSGLNFYSKYYGDDDHGSVPLIAEYDAIRAMYSWYRLKGLDQYFNPKSTATPEEVIKKVSDHYKMISEHFGYNVLPPETFVNQLGYGLMGNNMPDKAYAFFNMNVQNYPESANVFDSMGDYYSAQKDTVHAIENYSKALTLSDAPYTKEKLKALQIVK